MKTVITTVFSLLFCFSLIAQTDFKTGYIINNSNERLNGNIKIINEFNKTTAVIFQPSSTQKELTFPPVELIGYGFTDGRFYESVRIPLAENDTTYIFAEKAVDGNIELFSFRHNGNKRRFFVRKAEQPIIELIQTISYENRQVGIGQQRTFEKTENQYVRDLRKLMTDCSKYYDNIEDTDFQYEKLIDLIFNYNACVNPYNAQRFAIYSQQKLNNWAVYAGAGLSNYRFVSENTLYDGNESSNVTPIIGGFYESNLPNFNPKFFLRFDLLFKGFDMRAQFRQEFVPRTENFTDYDWRLKGIHAQLQFSPVYKVATEKMDVYGRVGVVVGGFIYSKNTEIQLRHPNNIIGFDPPKEAVAHDGGGGIGFIAGGGMQFGISKQRKIFVDLRLQRLSAASDTQQGVNYKMLIYEALLTAGLLF